MIAGPLVAGVVATTLSNALAPFLIVMIVAGFAALLAGWVFWPSKLERKKRGR
jgi:hypothetical protein